MTDNEYFIGFSAPEQNWSRLPHQFIDAMPLISTKGELQVILYVLRHTWGFQDDRKRITLDEFENGRKRKDGSRLDNGCGASRPAIVKGIQRAIEHGFLILEKEGDDARPRHYYRLRNVTAEVTEHDHGSNETCLRSEKETSETNHEKEHAVADNGDEKSSDKNNSGHQRKPRTLDVLRADLETHFLEVTGLPPPPTNTDKQRRAAGALWWRPLMRLASACGNDAEGTKRMMDWAIAEMDQKGWKVSSPNSIVKTALAEQGNRKRKAGKTRPLQGSEPQRKVLSDEEGEEFQRQMRIKDKAKREREKQEAVAVA